MIQNIFIAVILALLVALGLVTFDRYRAVGKLETAHKELGIKDGQLQALQNDLSSKDKLIADQNAGIDELNKLAQERATKAAQAVADAKKDSARNKEFAQRLLLYRRKSENVCKDADNLIQDWLKGY